ncbi:hypothetical protein [Halothermothrix orenii]|uniref:Uncharacterized protein n=1 Tax=Halothermothrix orenii (strain H 168 / OCM 544 / DSM 9562) TaxID=373903 RepID=B8CWQ5_HALOH|nr:hypothetical protein [Halothermothrix orenii]ACL69724.1 hypothetical protein Hore_09680 [Halothermothrix orenii H 168]
MGVRFKRDYDEIVQELVEALGRIDNFYEFVDLSDEEWNSLSQENQERCLEALSIDVFYGLGGVSSFPVGKGQVSYDQDYNVIRVTSGDNVVSVIKLD